MISDDERHEVAARLRELAAHPDPDEDVYYGDLVDCGLLQRGTYSGHVTPESVERLADLIDRPTCRNEDGSGRSFSCSACGYEAWTYDDSCCDPKDFSFCPNCGAELVVGDGDDGQ